MIDLTNLVPRIRPIGWNIYDKIICIHYLPYRERLTNIKSELKRVGILDLPQFEFYETIDNELYNDILNGIPEHKIGKTRSYSPRVHKFNINYTIDSYSLLKKLNFYGYERVLIIEDDVFFHSNVKLISDILNSTPMDFDIVNYDPVKYKDEYGKYIGEYIVKNQYFYECKNTKISNASCIGLSKYGIQTLIDGQHERLEPFDICHLTHMERLKTYCVKDGLPICIQNCLYKKKQSESTFRQKYNSLDISQYNCQCDKIEPQLIVSLTSYPHRFKNEDFVECLKSLVNQKTNVEYLIVLNLFKDDYALLPNSVLNYVKDNHIEIVLHDTDIRQHKKYLKVMQKYASLPVVTVDDDTKYSSNLVQDLWKTHIENPLRIICGRCDKVTRDDTGQILPYEQWEQMIPIKNCKDDGLFGVGVGGILYPSSFCENISDKLLDIIPIVRSDDFLLFIIANILGFKYMTVNSDNKYSRSGGAGFLADSAFSCHADENALWIVNKQNNYKNELIKYLYKFKSVEQFIDNVQNDTK